MEAIRSTGLGLLPIEFLQLQALQSISYWLLLSPYHSPYFSAFYLRFSRQSAFSCVHHLQYCLEYH
ncbi:unnamed protein product [Onchocerca flexuosa]|uniref:Ovule protein n=1 Tax=Onchocerca flexuosa TaxID=387005 RepID=A0A183HSP2_9BILA|nr:unnamed protein product [Onchocerca flexuosa]